MKHNGGEAVSNYFRMCFEKKRQGLKKNLKIMNEDGQILDKKVLIVNYQFIWQKFNSGPGQAI